MKCPNNKGTTGFGVVNDSVQSGKLSLKTYHITLLLNIYVQMNVRQATQLIKNRRPPDTWSSVAFAV